MDGLVFILPIIILFFVLFIYLVPVGLWVQALVTIGWGQVSLIKLVVMRIRRIPPRQVVDGIINLHRAGLSSISSEDLETHVLAGGSLSRVVNAMIAADKANIPLEFATATAIDLAGRDVQEAVQTSVYPKVIDVPVTGTIRAVAKDGIQLKVRARVTVRTNIEQLVGGATEETVIARVGEGIVSAIGSAENYKAVLENPDTISKAVLDRSLDAGTAFAILSIDIADVDVDKNVGADLQTEQAEADLKVAQARAETRRAMAVAAEQEFVAKVEEMRAKVVEAEAEVPKAMAQAFREGNLGVMGYANMRNIQGETGMRKSISEPGSGGKTAPGKKPAPGTKPPEGKK
ncbi:MAG: flotillin-like protein FloA [Candidatus Marinimicrobia bacterium]|nr:flotillin-like protein FloA [Candidatus Neomarinimicrobiota bacterium]